MPALSLADSPIRQASPERESRPSLVARGLKSPGYIPRAKVEANSYPQKSG